MQDLCQVAHVSAGVLRRTSNKQPPALNTSYVFDLIIVGAGPAGLSCAIEAKKAGLISVVLEKGSLVDAIRRFPTNLVWFSTPELLEIGGIPFVVSTLRPTRVDTLNYYQKVARTYELDVRLFDPITHVARNEDLFSVNSQRGRSYAGRNVVVATGYFDHPNWLDVPGETLAKVFHYYQESFQFFDCDVAVVGGRNSAVEAALDLYRHGARVTLIHRGETLSDGVKYWILPDIQNRIKTGEVKALFRTTVLEFGRPASSCRVRMARRPFRMTSRLCSSASTPTPTNLSGVESWLILSRLRLRSMRRPTKPTSRDSTSQDRWSLVGTPTGCSSKTGGCMVRRSWRRYGGGSDPR